MRQIKIPNQLPFSKICKRDQNYDLVVLLGDFNLVRNYRIDKRHGNIPRKKSLQKLEDILRKFDFTDIWWEKHQNVKQYTRSQANTKIQCRLDYIFI